jgi:hypothetical protein
MGNGRVQEKRFSVPAGFVLPNKPEEVDSDVLLYFIEQ